MHIHILGICGTFMGSLAILAREMGHQVTGCDANVYPPMSTQLEAAGIKLTEGYDPAQLDPAPDCIIVGNAMSRGNPCVEYMLDKGLKFTSGPQWLHDHVLPERWVLAVAGTHGKTTTATMLAWILEQAGMAPGFLIGGVPNNFDRSARLGDTPFFVIEADEYDTAFFDKRSKFVHYSPRTVILNNLEFDHADIFPDLGAIQRQFHHLVRIIPGSGRIIAPKSCEPLSEVLEMGCWSELERTGVDDTDAEWAVKRLAADGSSFEIHQHGKSVAQVDWQLNGEHNMHNALHALLAARHVGVTPELAAKALNAFGGVKRRMEKLAEVGGITVYDDFAHHPTAIETTLAGARAHVGDAPLIAVIEPRSNTMRLGTLRAALAPATTEADRVYWYQPKGLGWSLHDVVDSSQVPAQLSTDLDALVEQLVDETPRGAHVVIMSNGSFGGLHQKLIAALKQRYPE